MGIIERASAAVDTLEWIGMTASIFLAGATILASFCWAKAQWNLRRRNSRRRTRGKPPVQLKRHWRNPLLLTAHLLLILAKGPAPAQGARADRPFDRPREGTFDEVFGPPLERYWTKGYSDHVRHQFRHVGWQRDKPLTFPDHMTTTTPAPSTDYHDEYDEHGYPTARPGHLRYGEPTSDGEATLIGYNCPDGRSRFKAINALDPGDCGTKISDFGDPTEIGVRMVQHDRSATITAARCLIRTTRRVTYCWFNSLTHAAKTIELGKVNGISPSVCEWAVGTGVIEFDGRVFNITNIPGTYHGTYHSHGSVDNNGNCEVEDFLRNGHRYKYHYEETEITIELEHVTGLIDLRSGKLKFSSLGNLLVDFKDGTVVDSYAGRLSWSNRPTACTNTTTLLYRGKAEIRRRTKIPPGDDAQMGAIVLIKNPTAGQYAGAVVGPPTNVCDQTCYATQTDGLSICFIEDPTIWEPSIPGAWDYKDSEINFLRMDLQTQISYLHLEQMLHTNGRFEEVYDQICQLEKSALTAKLQRAAQGDPYAFLEDFGPGHQVEARGNAIYLVSCQPVTVRFRDHNNCTRGVPVSYRGSAKFLDPFTHILQEVSPIVACSRVMPQTWLIGSEWMCAYPELAPCAAPERIPSKIESYDEQGGVLNLTRGVGKSLFTAERRANFFTLIHAREGREAAAEHYGYTALSHASDGNIRSYISNFDINSLTEDLGSRIFPLFYTLGRAWYTFIGVLIILSLAKIVATCAWRGVVLYNDRGCGWWLIGAFWGVAYAMLRLPSHFYRGFKEAFDTDDVTRYVPRPRDSSKRRTFHDDYRDLEPPEEERNESKGKPPHKRRRHSDSSDADESSDDDAEAGRRRRKGEREKNPSKGASRSAVRSQRSPEASEERPESAAVHSRAAARITLEKGAADPRTGPKGGHRGRRQAPAKPGWGATLRRLVRPKPTRPSANGKYSVTYYPARQNDEINEQASLEPTTTGRQQAAFQPIQQHPLPAFAMATTAAEAGRQQVSPGTDFHREAAAQAISLGNPHMAGFHAAAAAGKLDAQGRVDTNCADFVAAAKAAIRNEVWDPQQWGITELPQGPDPFGGARRKRHAPPPPSLSPAPQDPHQTNRTDGLAGGVVDLSTCKVPGADDVEPTTGGQ